MSILPPLSDKDVATIQAARADAALMGGALLGVGGSSWTVSRVVPASVGSGHTADGIFGPVRGSGTPNTPTLRTVTLLVVPRKQNQIVVAPSQAFLPTEVWVAVAPLPVDIQDGDHITSVADSTLQFDVVNVVRHPGYARLDLRETK